MRRSAENVTKDYLVKVMCDFMRSPVSERVMSTSMTMVLALSFITESPVPAMVFILDLKITLPPLLVPTTVSPFERAWYCLAASLYARAPE